MYVWTLKSHVERMKLNGVSVMEFYYQKMAFTAFQRHHTHYSGSYSHFVFEKHLES